MPLVKEVCQRCMGKESVTSGLRWIHNDENRLKQGFINCFYNPDSFNGVLLPLDSDPPAWCEFALEHTVLGQKKRWGR